MGQVGLCCSLEQSLFHLLVILVNTEGLRTEAIVTKMRDPKTVYRLALAELAYLHDQGIADPVISYMQETYLETVRWEQNLVDWNTNEMWEITFDKPREGKETTGGKEASLKIRRLARRMEHNVTKTIFSVGPFMCS